MIIAFPEFSHPKIQTGIEKYHALSSIDTSLPPLEALPASDLASACDLVNLGEADAVIAGIEYSTRDVILTCRDAFSMSSFIDDLANPDELLGIPISREPYRTFSGLAVMKRDNQIFLLSDMAACKHPTKEQLIEIIQQTYTAAQVLLPDEPRIALLTFSSFGSGGKDDSISLMHEVLDEFTGTNLIIDGEMQLDTALVPEIADSKFPDSPVAGHANVLIVPDLNSGNILYKAFEHIGGFTVAGPILQGFDALVSDLSRGSNADDVAWTIENLARLGQARGFITD